MLRHDLVGGPVGALHHAGVNRKDADRDRKAAGVQSPVHEHGGEAAWNQEDLQADRHRRWVQLHESVEDTSATLVQGAIERALSRRRRAELNSDSLRRHPRARDRNQGRLDLPAPIREASQATPLGRLVPAVISRTGDEAFR
jgi:hypothetical protein